MNKVIAAAVLLALAASPVLADVQFRHPLDDMPADVPLPEAEQRTEAVLQFHRTGENPYVGQAEAIAAGREVYNEWCQSCHMPQGTGRIGPSLVDEDNRYPRTETAVGMFEVIYFGATGAMQSFADRLSQDEILQVIAYVDQLQERVQGAGQMAKQPAKE